MDDENFGNSSDNEGDNELQFDFEYKQILKSKKRQNKNDVPLNDNTTDSISQLQLGN